MTQNASERATPAVAPAADTAPVPADHPIPAQRPTSTDDHPDSTNHPTSTDRPTSTNHPAPADHPAPGKRPFPAGRPVPAEHPLAADGPAPAGRAAQAGRLVGVDLARGLAVFGMYAAHVGPDPSVGGATGFVMELAHGRASALFAFLAGFSIILMTGRRAPRTGREGRQAVVKVLIRAAVLLAVGTWLTSTGTPVEVILAYYGLFFVMVLPFYRLRPATLAALAAGTALLLPQLLYAAQQSVYDGTWSDTAVRYDPLARVSGTDGFIELLFTGSYPALAWIPFVLAGMAVARLDLASAAVRARLAVTGVGLAVLGYGGSWLALHLVPGVRGALTESIREEGYGSGSPLSLWWSDTAGYPSGDTTAWLWAASPHSETTLSVLGNTGVALAVLVACVAAVECLPRFRRLAAPVVAVGSMSLTAYVFHVVGIHFLGIDELPGPSLRVLLGFSVAVTLLAVVWSRFFRRGPLEHVLNGATKVARHVK
ncbi:heparan-alpha-glucosaminide N-acetyltransferase domain-containing protein [Streptomyces sp. NPDC001815]|uniref:heparan-alpha-glucosaminide N-acetyltransferase domain-containing protein n=1 Tax=Streptomyces sp. NPDC001815 TaxID=3154526 RepID=UPI00331C6C8B